jgi:hypothetical protein
MVTIKSKDLGDVKIRYYANWKGVITFETLLEKEFKKNMGCLND